MNTNATPKVMKTNATVKTNEMVEGGWTRTHGRPINRGRVPGAPHRTIDTILIMCNRPRVTRIIRWGTWRRVHPFHRLHLTETRPI